MPITQQPCKQAARASAGMKGHMLIFMLTSHWRIHMRALVYCERYRFKATAQGKENMLTRQGKFSFILFRLMI